MQRSPACPWPCRESWIWRYTHARTRTHTHTYYTILIIYCTCMHTHVHVQVFLQVLIMLTGNYNFFNVVTITLSVSLLDDEFFSCKCMGMLVLSVLTRIMQYGGTHRLITSLWHHYYVILNTTMIVILLRLSSLYLISSLHITSPSLYSIQSLK